MSTAPKATRTVRTDVPSAVFAALEERALHNGTTVAAEAREALLTHVSQAIAPPTKRQWNDCLTWLEAEGITPHALKMTLGLTTKRQALDWARQNGYDA